MSQELVGSCGAIVGSGEYFQRINHGAIFAPFLGGYQYSSAIGQLCSRCVSVMEEIYSDMRNAPTTVFALPEDQKENLRKTIANLDEAASFLFPAYTCATACRAMLEIDKPESDSGIGNIWGQDIGSNSYIQSKCSPIYQSILADSFSNIRLTLISDLANIAQQIAADIDHGLDANLYMKDENGAAIQGAIDELERCNCMALSSHRSKTGRLCWYQDVPKDQVLALQKSLNKIPEFGTLTEDGIYGEKTRSSLEQILDGLTHGAFPSLTYINPLQTSMTGIEATLKTTKSGMQFSQIVQVGSNIPLFRADLHRFGNVPQYYHINVKVPAEATAMQKSIASQFDHMEISPETYITSEHRARKKGKWVVK